MMNELDEWERRRHEWEQAQSAYRVFAVIVIIVVLAFSFGSFFVK